MELHGDHTVFLLYLLGQKDPFGNLVKHIGIGIIGTFAQLFFEEFAKGLLVAALFQTVTVVVFLAVTGVSNVIFFVCLIAKDLHINFSRPISPNIGFQPQQILLMLFVCFHLGVGQISFPVKDIRQQSPIIKGLQHFNQLKPLLKNGLKRPFIFLKTGGKGNTVFLCVLQILIIKNILQFYAAAAQKVENRQFLLLIAIPKLKQLPQLLFLFRLGDPLVLEDLLQSRNIRTAKIQIIIIPEIQNNTVINFAKINGILHTVKKEMPPGLNDMVQSQKNQPHIVGGFPMNQFAAQMIHRRIISVIIFVGIILVGEKGIDFPGSLVLGVKVAFLQLAEKTGIYRRDLTVKEHFQQIQPLSAALGPPPGRAIHPALLGGFAFIKKPNPPGSIGVKFQNVVIKIGHSPTHRIGTDIQPKVVRCFL